MFQKDQLSREPFIFLVKDIISTQLLNDKGVTFAIDGEWGCGKTWIINELENEYNNDEKYLVIHYNAWKYDYYNEPIEAILTVIIETLNKSNIKIKNKKKTIKILCSIVEILSIPFGNKRINIINKIISKIKKLYKLIKKRNLSQNDFDKNISLTNALNLIKTTLSILANQIKIIFIVDELDRCLPEYAIKVLERLHHICNEQPIITIISIDKDKLANSINKVFGDPISNKEQENVIDFADKYLEKFIDKTIPLDNGKISKEDTSVFGKFKESFSPIQPDNFGSDEFVMDFYSYFFEGVEKRHQEKIIEIADLVHNVTISRYNELHPYSNFVLCLEILAVMEHDCGLSYSYIYKFSPDGKTLYLKNNYYGNMSEKSENLHKKIQSYMTISLEGAAISEDGNYLYVLAQNDKQLLANYFLDIQKGSKIDDYIETIRDEKEFLRHFREILYTL